MNTDKKSLQLLLKELKSDSNQISKLVSEQHLESVIGGLGKFNKFSAIAMAALNILASTNTFAAFDSNITTTTDANILKNSNISEIIKKLTVPVLVTGGVVLLPGFAYLLISKLKNCKSINEFKKVQDEAHNILTNRDSVIAYLDESRKTLLKQTKKNQILYDSINRRFDNLKHDISNCEFESQKDVRIFTDRIKTLSNESIDQIERFNRSSKILNEMEPQVEQETYLDEREITDDFDRWMGSLESYLYDIVVSVPNYKQNYCSSYFIRRGLNSSCSNKLLIALDIANRIVSNNTSSEDIDIIFKAIHNSLDVNVDIKKSDKDEILNFLKNNNNLDVLKRYLRSEHTLLRQVQEEYRKFGDQKVSSLDSYDINYYLESFRRLFNASRSKNSLARNINCIGLIPDAMTMRVSRSVDASNLEEVAKLINKDYSSNNKSSLISWGRKVYDKWFYGSRTMRFKGNYDLHGSQNGLLLTDFLFGDRANQLRDDELANLLYAMYYLNKFCMEAGFRDYQDLNIDAEDENIPCEMTKDWDTERICLYNKSRQEMKYWSEDKKRVFDLWCLLRHNFEAIDGDFCKNQICRAMDSVQEVVDDKLMGPNHNVNRYFTKMFRNMANRTYNVVISDRALNNEYTGVEAQKSLKSFLKQLVNIPRVSSETTYLNCAVTDDIAIYNDIINVYRDCFTVDLLIETFNDCEFDPVTIHNLNHNAFNSPMNFKLLNILTNNRLSEELKCISDCYGAYLSDKGYILPANEKLPSLDYAQNESGTFIRDKFIQNNIVNKSNRDKFIYAYKYYIDSLLSGKISDILISRLYPIYFSLVNDDGILDAKITPSCLENVRKYAIIGTEDSKFLSDIFFDDNGFTEFKKIFNKIASIRYIYKLIDDGYFIFDESVIEE